MYFIVGIQSIHSHGWNIYVNFGTHLSVVKCSHMIWVQVAWVYIDEQLVMVHNDRVVHCILFFGSLNHTWCASFCHGLQISIKVSSMNPIQPGNSHKCVPKDTLSSTVGHWISLPSALLMHDAMNNASSHNGDLDQFHMNVWYLVMLSCFVLRIKLRRHCFRWMVCLIQLVLHLVLCKTKKN